MRKAVFLDRDGVLNVDYGFVHNLKDLELFPEVTEALRIIQDKNYLLIVITNQSGIGRGIFTETQMHAFHQALRERLEQGGIHLNAIYFCPHAPEDNCSCRKPRTLLVEQALKDFDIDPKKSYFVGDRESDIICGESLGMQTFLVTHSQHGTLVDFAHLLS